jgi:hypothetical protein
MTVTPTVLLASPGNCDESSAQVFWLIEVVLFFFAGHQKFLAMSHSIPSDKVAVSQNHWIAM